MFKWLYNLLTLEFLKPSLGAVGSVVGIASGVSSIFGGDSGGVGNTAGGAYYDPFQQYRSTYANQLNTLMSNPSSVTSLPGYQFGMNQGAEALNRTMAATGQSQSGNQQIALSQFGQQYAGDFYQKQLNNLMVLSGATQSPMNVTGQNQLNNQNTQAGWSSLAQGLGGLANVFNNGNSSGGYTPLPDTSANYWSAS